MPSISVEVRLYAVAKREGDLARMNDADDGTREVMEAREDCSVLFGSDGTPLKKTGAHTQYHLETHDGTSASSHQILLLPTDHLLSFCTSFHFVILLVTRSRAARFPNRPLRHRLEHCEIRSQFAPRLLPGTSWPNSPRHGARLSPIFNPAAACSLGAARTREMGAENRQAEEGGQLPGTKWMICPELTAWDLVRTRRHLLPFVPGGSCMSDRLRAILHVAQGSVTKRSVPWTRASYQSSPPPKLG
ncbi:hypothetical protein QBC34DRAFT_203607 [Podospora aff. communis PSN243]|uniref:Uncharacterized protein n=1 Tax=Podospora aff. communis PSN243 TaxID=3040156 RepID=A0AAV9GZW0_9PEZI|nr:hypothetical protein QBC34DRAFT_203607 [Podospora aff. communis PSN243]